MSLEYDIIWGYTEKSVSQPFKQIQKDSKIVTAPFKY